MTVIKLMLGDFSFLGYDLCKRRILAVNGMPGLSEDASELERNIYFGSLISFDHLNMVVSNFIPWHTT